MTVAEAPGVAGDEGFAFLVEQHDGEHLVVDEAAQKLADALEQRIEIENGGQLDGDLIEHFEGLRLARDASVEASVLNRLCDARRGERKDVKMLRTKESELLAFNIHYADEAIFGDEGNSEFGAHVGIGGDVKVRGGDVVEENGLAGERNLANHAFADGNAGALDLRSMADLESHAQLMGALVQQEDGKDAVGDDGAHEFSGAAEEGLQVESGVERVGEAHEVGDISRLDAGVDGVEVCGRA